MTPGYNEARRRPRHLAPWWGGGVEGSHSLYIDPVLVTSGAEQTARSCALSARGRYHGRFASQTPPPPIHPCFALQGIPLIPHCDLLCCCTSEPGTHCEAPVLVCLMWFLGRWRCGGGGGGARSSARLTGPKNVQRVSRTPARKRGRTLLPLLIGLIFLASSVRILEASVERDLLLSTPPPSLLPTALQDEFT